MRLPSSSLWTPRTGRASARPDHRDIPQAGLAYVAGDKDKMGYCEWREPRLLERLRLAAQSTEKIGVIGLGLSVFAVAGSEWWCAQTPASVVGWRIAGGEAIFDLLVDARPRFV